MIKICKQCNKEFIKPINESKKNWEFRHKFCSKSCYTKSMKGKDILGKNKNKIAWNKGKEMLNMRGKNHPNYKDGGIYRNERHTEMGRIEYKLWRDACFARDGYTCQKYRIIGGDLEVHHIDNWKDFPQLRLSIDNGITLSKKAHKEFHKKYGMKHTTKAQLLEFLTQEA